MRGGNQAKHSNTPAQSQNLGLAKNRQNQTSSKINWLQTFIQNKGRPEHVCDLVYKRFVNQANTNTIIVWDTSASTLRNKAASKAKALVLTLFEHAYLKRQRIGLLEFSADDVRVITPCQRVNRELITPTVATLSVGGNTPIESAVAQAGVMLKQAQNNQPDALSKLILITDGYFKQLPAKPGFEVEIVIADIDQGRVKIGQCEALANLWQAQLIHVN